MLKRPQVIAVNKSDLLKKEEIDKVKKEFKAEKLVVNLISARDNIGLEKLVKKVYNKLKKIPKTIEAEEPEITEIKDVLALKKIKSGVYRIESKRVEKYTAMLDFENSEVRLGIGTNDFRHIGFAVCQGDSNFVCPFNNVEVGNDSALAINKKAGAHGTFWLSLCFTFRCLEIFLEELFEGRAFTGSTFAAKLFGGDINDCWRQCVIEVSKIFRDTAPKGLIGEDESCKKNHESQKLQL